MLFPAMHSPATTIATTIPIGSEARAGVLAGKAITIADAAMNKTTAVGTTTKTDSGAANWNSRTRWQMSVTGFGAAYLTRNPV